MEKRILHLDMDAFFASVEQAINPKLKGKPLIVGGRENKKRTVVCAASYEAKKKGVDSGMSCQEAFRLCPEAEFVPADSAKYLYVSGEISQLLTRYSPQVEQASVDEFYLDITGCSGIFGSEHKLAGEIKDRIRTRFDIIGSVGISLNRLMSKIASKLEKPDGLVILNKNDISRRLADLPIGKIPGIGKSLSCRLNALSIFSFQDLQKPPLEFFQERFGKIGLWIYGAAHPEEDAEGVHWYCEKPALPKSVGHSYTLQYNIQKKEAIQAWLRLLCEMVGTRLRKLKLESNTLHIYLRKPNLEFIGKEKNFHEYTNDSLILYERALFILDKLGVKSMVVRALGVTARSLVPANANSLLPGQTKQNQVFKAQDQINERFGEWTIYPASISLIK